MIKLLFFLAVTFPLFSYSMHDLSAKLDVPIVHGLVTACDSLEEANQQLLTWRSVNKHARDIIDNPLYANQLAIKCEDAYKTYHIKVIESLKTPFYKNYINFNLSINNSFFLQIASVHEIKKCFKNPLFDPYWCYDEYIEYEPISQSEAESPFKENCILLTLNDSIAHSIVKYTPDDFAASILIDTLVKKYNFDINHRAFNQGTTVLNVAISRARIPLIKNILRHKPTINNSNMSFLHNPLEHCLRYYQCNPADPEAYAEIAHLLLQQGADISLSPLAQKLLQSKKKKDKGLAYSNKCKTHKIGRTQCSKNIT